MSVSTPYADFMPNLTGYSGQRAFRFWCQKVLPIVYDDSLSYYELLAKVVNYLNNTISDVATCEENIDSLATAYRLLEEFVNNYTITVTPELVEQVLREHPEWVTTVQNNSVDSDKFTENVRDVLISESKAVFLYKDPTQCNNYPTNNFGFGSSTVIYDDNTVIIYDFGYDNGVRVTNYIVNNFTKLNGVIISHFHGDHANFDAVYRLLTTCVANNIDISECVFYLPHKNIDWSVMGASVLQQQMQQIVELLDSYGGSGLSYVWPEEEGETFNVNDMKISFYNVDSSLYGDPTASPMTGYYGYTLNEHNSTATNPADRKPNYNNFSMCAMMELNGAKLFLTGDIMYPAQHNMAYLLHDVNCLMVPHHGLDMRDDENFVDGVCSEVSVIPSYYNEREMVVKQSIPAITNRCREVGNIVCTLNNDVEVTFINRHAKISSTNNQLITGEYVGQLLFYGENLNDLHKGLYYTQNVDQSSTIVNWPTLWGDMTEGHALFWPYAGHIKVTPSTWMNESCVQEYWSSFSGNMRRAYRKMERVTVEGQSVYQWTAWICNDTNNPRTQYNTRPLTKVADSSGTDGYRCNFDYTDDEPPNGCIWDRYTADIRAKGVMGRGCAANSYLTIATGLPKANVRQPVSAFFLRASRPYALSAYIEASSLIVVTINEALQAGDVVYIKGKYDTVFEGNPYA